MFELLAQASQPTFQTLEDFGNWQTIVAGVPILGAVIGIFWKIVSVLLTTMKDSEARYQAFAKEIVVAFKESSKEVTVALKELGSVVQELRDAVRDNTRG